MKLKSNSNLTMMIAVAWVLTITLGYFFTHYVPLIEFIKTSLPSLMSLVIVILFTILAGGIGNRLLSRWTEQGGFRYGIEVMLGYGILALITLLIGVLFRINASILTILLLFCFLVFIKFNFRWLRGLFSLLPGPSQTYSIFEKAIFLYFLLIFLIQLIQSMAPAIKYDALMYHLTLPKAYLAAERIIDLPWIVMSGMPQTTEILYMIVMALGGESAALLLSWMFGVLISIFLYTFLRQYLPNRSTMVGTASLFSGYTLVSILSWGYVDLASCFFGLGSIMALDVFFQKKDQQALMISGLMAGLTFGTKYPAGVLYLAIVITLAIYGRFSLRGFIIPALKLSLGAAVFAFPWLIKNLIMTGNPFYPFFFAAGAMDASRIAVYQGAEPYGDLFDLFLLPIRATMQGLEGSNGYSFSIGPLFLALGIIPVLFRRSVKVEHKGIMKWTAILSLIGLAIWAIGNQLSGFLIQTRFYFALFSAFAILAAFGYDYLISSLQTKKRWVLIINLFIVSALFLNLVELSLDFVKKQTPDYFTGQMDRQTYLEHNLGWYALVMNEINTLYKNDRVLLVYEPRGYACIPACNPDEILDEWKTSYINSPDSAQILAKWRKSGYTLLLVNRLGMRFLEEVPDPHHPASELTALDELLSELPLEKDYGGNYELYRLSTP